MTGSRVLALGHYQPSGVLTNDDLAKMVDTDDAWIRSRVGIRTRHVAAPDETVDSMAAAAAAKALANSGLTPQDIDLVLVATCTATDRSPNTAARVAARLGLDAPATMDLNVVCAGFTHALATADHAIRAGSATQALVIGAEKFTGVVDWTDRSTCVLVGDGAGAAVVSASRSRRSGRCCGARCRRWAVRSVSRAAGRFAQEGQTVYRWATTQLPAIARKVCERAGIAPADLAGVVLHQANLRIIEPVAERLGAVNAVVAKDVVESGNTSAASRAARPVQAGRAARDQLRCPVLLFAFGGNLSYAGQVIRCP